MLLHSRRVDCIANYTCVSVLGFSPTETSFVCFGQNTVFKSSKGKNADVFLS